MTKPKPKKPKRPCRWLVAVLMLFSLSASAQWTFEGDTLFVDTLDSGTKYMRVDYYTEDGVFTIPKGAVSLSICNIGGANGDITLRSQDATLYPQQCLQIGSIPTEGLRRVVALRIPAIRGDATGTLFAIIEQR